MCRGAAIFDAACSARVGRAPVSSGGRLHGHVRRAALLRVALMGARALPARLGPHSAGERVLNGPVTQQRAHVASSNHRRAAASPTHPPHTAAGPLAPSQPLLSPALAPADRTPRPRRSAASRSPVSPAARPIPSARDRSHSSQSPGSSAASSVMQRAALPEPT